MKRHKAFTLIELLIVIGMILILVGILLPVLTNARRRAQIIAGKADLQTITTALESYHHDFGDYPRNIQLPRWNTQNTLNVPAPQYLSLAAALLGSGPGVTQIVGGNLEAGDGADGLGFRSQTQVIPVSLTGPVGVGVTQVILQNPSTAATTFLNNYVPGTTVAWITLSAGNNPNTLPSPTEPEETLGIGSVSGTTINFTNGIAPAYPHPQTDTFVIKVATGKIWPNYLSADTFKVAFISQQVDANNIPLPYGQPVLLDRWGQVIQYFPRYGPANNRFYDSKVPATITPPASSSVMAGPLYGYAQPASIDSTNGQNAMWDFRDGAPFFTSVSGQVSSSPIQSWEPLVSTPPTSMWVPYTVINAPPYFDPVTVMQWMLGDLDPTTTPPAPNNYIDSNDKLLFDGPFILISAGPDGPNRPNGGFCSFLIPEPKLPVIGIYLSPGQWQQTFAASGNIYNFDRQ